MSSLSQLAVRQPLFLRRVEAACLRRLLAGRSPDEVSCSRLAAKAVRFPIPDAFFELHYPHGESAWLDAASAPLLYWLGFDSYEPTVVPTFADYAARARTFVDVGAAFGFYSLLARAVNPSIAVTSIEPNPRHAAVLEETFARNGADIRIVHAALADEAGTVELSLRGGLSSIQSDRWEPGSATVPVHAMTFDKLVVEPPDLVKIDVEGAELRVLRGMASTLSQRSTTIFCEVAPANLGAVVELLAGHGYEVVELPGQRLIERGDSSKAENFLIRPRDESVRSTE
jgi:FkbM family methyltransferase